MIHLVVEFLELVLSSMELKLVLINLVVHPMIFVLLQIAHLQLQLEQLEHAQTLQSIEMTATLALSMIDAQRQSIKTEILLQNANMMLISALLQPILAKIAFV